MKYVAALMLAGILCAATGYAQGAGATPGGQADQKDASKSAAKDTAAPAPIAVEVVAVDPDAKTITVRDIAAIPAPAGKAVEVKLPVPASATGQKLSDVKKGDKVDVTCAVKPTVHPTAGVPIVLTDCVRVIKIDTK
jgi:Cu/Ag efflux protein CusF